MKFFLLVIILLPFVISGCNRAAAQSSPPTEPTPAAVYKAQLGIQFSPVALQTIGVESAEVAARDFPESKGAAAVPEEALLRTVKGDFIYVANGGWFLRTPVKLGASQGGWFEIKEGLYEGDRIVTRGARSVWLAELQAVNGGVGCADGH